MRVAALIPAFREESHIADVVRRTLPYVEKVLVVDDGSGDKTGENARSAGVDVLTHVVNQGKGVSLSDGLNFLFDEGFDSVVCLDADGQHLPEEIPGFIKAAEEADLVIGNRMAVVKDMPTTRLWTNRFTSWVLGKLAGVRVPDTQCGFRLIRRECWQGIEIKTRNYDFEGEMIVAAGRAGFRITSVRVTTVYGDEVSTINPVRDTTRFFRMVWRLWRC